MKTLTVTILFCMLFLLGCQHETKSPIEGTWNLVYFKWTLNDSTVMEFPGNLKECSGKWILLKDNSLFYMRYKGDQDTTYTLKMGDAKFKLDGSNYQETYTLAPTEHHIGKTLHYKVTLKNDTLTLEGPEKDSPNADGAMVLEKYVRL